jgi:hypothetical protein
LEQLIIARSVVTIETNGKGSKSFIRGSHLLLIGICRRAFTLQAFRAAFHLNTLAEKVHLFLDNAFNTTEVRVIPTNLGRVS